MTVLGRAETFRQQWTAGLVAAYGRMLRQVPGASGVLRTDVPTQGRVAVLIGGGCGHYPAFAGLVGPGLAHGAVIGEVFTSPSAEQAYRLATEADGGAGVLFSFGNYSGDVMHFGLAARRLAADGIASRTVLVTDDVASGPQGERRGVAGGLFVFRVASAAADRGADLDEVARLAAKANTRTRTFGVAFGGCTLPGASEPLFSVEPGAMELGLGIHGEPGIRSVDQLDAPALADTLVATLLGELPDGGDGRVAVLLNGLGRTKYEEMFVCYGYIDARLRAAGLVPCRPEVGEFVTSLDMAGLSLSLMVLDDELVDLLEAPCEAPGYRHRATGPLEAPAPAAAPPPAHRPGELDGQPTGLVATLLASALERVRANQDELGALDAVAGDGDHGLGMVRGLTAAVRAAEEVEGQAPGEPADASAVGSALLAAGTAHADAAGGASGALYGALLTETGAALREAGHLAITTALLASAVSRAQEAVVDLGGAKLGDKTMLDALDPFRAALHDAAADSPARAWSTAAQAAAAGAEATRPMVASRGRAGRLGGGRSIGHPDPGAVSLAMIVQSIGEQLQQLGEDRGDG